MIKIKASTAEGRRRKPVRPSFCGDPGWRVHRSDVQNKWDDNTQTHTQPQQAAVLSLSQSEKSNIIFLFFLVISLTVDGPLLARLPIPPTATLSSRLWSGGIKDLPVSPRFRPYDFSSRDASSALLQLVN